MTYKISSQGISLIKEFEGCRLKAYRCAAGVLTIGYGHTSGVTSGMVISLAEAEALLLKDLAKYEKAVNGYNLSWINQNRFDALVSFAFNCGTGNLKTLLANGSRTAEQVSNKLPAYNKAAGKVLNGLVRRRKAEKELFDKPVESTKTVYYPAYKGSSPSIVAALKACGETDTSLTNRKKIGVLNGISGVGTLAGNCKMLSLLKQGLLKRV